MELTTKQKAAFGIGAVGKDMVYALSASYVMYYYQDVLGLSATFVGLILMIARVFDAFNDPFMGVLVAKTRTRWGRFRPWIFSGTVLTAAVSVPEGGSSADSADVTVSWRSGGANITDAPSLRALLEDLAALKVTECVAFRPSDDAVTFCGFQDPVTLTVHYQTATGIEGVFEMNVGTQNMGGTGRYVRFGDEPAIYLMELELLDPMMRLAYQGMEEAS